MIIREANSNDLEALNVLFTKLFNYESNKYNKNNVKDAIFTSYFKEESINDKSIILVCEIDNNIIGYIHGYDKCFITSIEKEYYISTIYINDNYRNQGIGTKLIEVFINKAKEKGAKYINITNYLENNEAASLYSKFGFNVIKEDRRKEL